jgi:hypothetical protein
MQKYTMNAQSIILYIATALKRHPRGISLQAMGDCSDQVHSDHTILGAVRWEAGPQKKEAAKGSQN